MGRRWRGRGAAVIALGVGLLTVPAPAAAVEGYPRPGDGTFSFAGKGYGHGRGMSQYGAYRGATLGNTAKQIVAHYYGGSTLGSVGNPQVRVRLERVTSDRAVYFTPAAGLTARDEATGAERSIGPTSSPAPDRWRVVTDSTGLRLQYETSPGAWASASIGSATSFTGSVRVYSNSVDSLRIRDEDESASRTYRGNFRVERLSASRIALVNIVRMEAYLRSVVPSESPSSWPAASLQAQAISARSYSSWYVAHPRGATYDICDNQNCQVYSGVSTERATTDAAVQATAGQALLVSGAAIRAEFSSSNGGWIEAGGTGHSAPRRDAWSDGTWDPSHRWTATFSASRLGSTLLGSGVTVTRIDVLDRDGIGDWGGRVTSMRLTGRTAGGSTVSETISGSAFRTAMGASTVRSTLFTVADATVLRWIGHRGNGTNSSTEALTFGPRNATALLGDWDGDGDQTPAVLDVVDGAWRWRLRNSFSAGGVDVQFSYGPRHCTPLVGDWDGDGDDTPGLACPEGGLTRWRLSDRNARSAPAYDFSYGLGTDIPVTGDWDGDGASGIGAVRPRSTGLRWALRNAAGPGGATADFTYGAGSSRPVVGDWDGNGAAGVGTVRQSGERWRWELRNAVGAGPASASLYAGLVSEHDPHTADWDGDGTTTPVVTG